MEAQHYALLEVDVTRTRQFIEDHKAQTGEALSFTGYLAFCLARAVDEDKSVQAYLKGRKHLVVFDDVDVFCRWSASWAGRPPRFRTSSVAPTTSRSWRSIARFATSRASPSHRAGAALGVPGHDVEPPGRCLGCSSDSFAPPAAATPPRVVTAAGTVGVTALGMAGRGGGWGLAPAGRSLLLIVGGIARKPAVIEEHSNRATSST